MIDKETVIGFEALYESARKCKRGVMGKSSVAGFMLDAIENVIKLEDELKHVNGKRYVARPTNTFEITHPKRRQIVSIAFRDRIPQRSLNDNAVYPQMTKSFIRDNWACQHGKGTDYARRRIEQMLVAARRKYGPDFYVVQFDIHGYYKHMRHDVAEGEFRKHLDPWTYACAEAVLRRQYPGDIGYNPGSQMVQIAGLSVLNPQDHYIKEVLRVKNCGRYMDDFPLIVPTLSDAEHCLKAVTVKLAEIGLEPNPKKTRIFKIGEGLKILGYIFRLAPSGKVLMLIDPANVKNHRQRLRKMAAKCRRGELPISRLYTCHAGWRNHASKGNTHKVLIRTDKYFKSLINQIKEANQNGRNQNQKTRNGSERAGGAASGNHERRADSGQSYVCSHDDWRGAGNNRECNARWWKQ